MSTENTTPDHPDQRADRRRKRRALLAGGIVLGIGAAGTLAAFTDSEFAIGTFSTGKFNIEGSGDGTTYADHDTATKAQALTFQLTATKMSPGQTVYAPFWMRTKAATTLDGNVKLNSVTPSGTLSTLLTYKMASNSSTCDNTTNFDWVSTNTAVNTVGTPNNNVKLTNGGASAGTPIKTCIAVTLSSDQNAVQNADVTNPTTVTWGWTATSVDS